MDLNLTKGSKKALGGQMTKLTEMESDAKNEI